MALEELKRAFVMLLASPDTRRRPIQYSPSSKQVEAIDAALERMKSSNDAERVSITEAKAPRDAA